MKALIRDGADGILVPVPQYPLYSATITLYGGTLVPYYLDEDAGWGAGVDALRSALAAARAAGTRVRALVVINPGNPTGQVLGRPTQEEMVSFCAEENLLLIADEVYQTNVYAAGRKFESFKRVLREMGPRYDAVRLASLNSISKGSFGECGRRGGYVECVNFPAGVKAQLYKLASINLCPNLGGQICMAMMMRPPAAGEPSGAAHAAERAAILGSLAKRAGLVVGALNELEGVSCRPVEGAMYAFPRLELPPGALAAAERAGRPADAAYCMELLEAAGIVTVPGSGFGQAPGTLHVRTTILPSEGDMAAVAQRWRAFHEGFLKRYAGGAVAAAAK